MEQMPQSKLNQDEQGLFLKIKSKNPEITEDGFLEIRKAALKIADPSARIFYEGYGFLMEEKPNQQEIDELRIKTESN